MRAWQWFAVRARTAFMIALVDTDDVFFAIAPRQSVVSCHEVKRDPYGFKFVDVPTASLREACAYLKEEDFINGTGWVPQAT